MLKDISTYVEYIDTMYRQRVQHAENQLKQGD